jgi:hypothetical protein
MDATTGTQKTCKTCSALVTACGALVTRKLSGDCYSNVKRLGNLAAHREWQATSQPRSVAALVQHAVAAEVQAVTEQVATTLLVQADKVDVVSSENTALTAQVAALAAQVAVLTAERDTWRDSFQTGSKANWQGQLRADKLRHALTVIARKLRDARRAQAAKLAAAASKRAATLAAKRVAS